LGPVNGIHWHMNTENTVEYIAVDEKRQVIPWVRTVRGDGTVKTFKSLDAPADEAALAGHELRKVDCIDCHNRPSHIYYPPFRTVNDAMAAGRLDPSLPNIRGIASRALTGKYAGMEEALSAAGHFVRDQYALNAPAVLREKAGSVERAIDEIRRIYARNFFPEMKVDWRAYPNNIGHMYNEGCFRCHDGRHVTADGEILASDCNICHLVVAQGPRGAVMSDLKGLDFIHPSDIGGAEREMKCSACHTGE